MFPERKGKLTVVRGPMFAEKTTTLISLSHRAEHANKKPIVFKPSIDNRWGTVDIKTHSGIIYKATVIENPKDILRHVQGIGFVGLDEAQFFDDSIVPVVDELQTKGIDVVAAGLPLDFRGEPFGSMPTLLSLADEVISLTAVCKYIVNGVQCNSDATRTQRILNGNPANYNEEIVVIGAEDNYEARCVTHHEVPGKPKIIFSS